MQLTLSTLQEGLFEFNFETSNCCIIPDTGKAGSRRLENVYNWVSKEPTRVYLLFQAQQNKKMKKSQIKVVS